MVRGFFKESLETMTEHVAASAVPVNAAKGVPVRKPRKQITFNQLVLKIHYIINSDNLTQTLRLGICLKVHACTAILKKGLLLCISRYLRI